MARDFLIAGESLVLVKGNAGTGISALSELGLSQSPIQVTYETKYAPLTVDAWGQSEVDVQFMGGAMNVSMNLIHFDPAVLAVCIAMSQGAAPLEGTIGRAGQRLGNNSARFALTNSLIGLNIVSPVANLPWRFYFAYMRDPPVQWPLGTEKSVLTVNFRVIPFSVDPYGGGTGSYGYRLFDRILDS